VRRFSSEVRRALGRWTRPLGRVHLLARRMGLFNHVFLGATLYALTFALACVAAFARFFLGWIAAFFLGLACGILPSHGVFGLWGCAAFLGSSLPSAAACGWIAAVSPLLFSLAAFVVPSSEALWRRSVGARPASAEEMQQLQPLISIFSALDPRCARRFRCRVVDSPRPEAFVRGRLLVVTTGLLRCMGLPGVLAHELSHLVSWDGLLTVALGRLGLWGDPLGSPGVYEVSVGWFAALVWGSTRWLVRIAGTGWVFACTGPLWVAFWRARERAADAYAARLGQAELLADHLEKVVHPQDRPRRYRYFDPYDHDPTALRVERLRAMAREAE
jgi:Zn-dependent protease with chaperone function